jgi:hypothetical protein
MSEESGSETGEAELARRELERRERGDPGEDEGAGVELGPRVLGEVEEIVVGLERARGLHAPTLPHARGRASAGARAAAHPSRARADSVDDVGGCASAGVDVGDDEVQDPAPASRPRAARRTPPTRVLELPAAPAVHRWGPL